MSPAEERLLFVITGSALGGSERVLHRLARAERPSWKAVEVCSLKPAGRFGSLLRDGGIPVESCGLRDGTGVGGALATLGAALPLMRVVRRLRPTLIHAFLFRAGLLARLPVALRRAPRLVVSIRQIEHRHRLLHLIDRCTSGAVDRFTAVSAAARTAIVLRSGIREDRIEVIPNGVEVHGPGFGAGADAVDGWRRARRERARRLLESLTGPLPGIVVGCAGRLDPVKGHRLLLEAFESLIAAGAAGSPSLVLAGDGGERAALQTAASRRPLLGRTHLIGERADLPEILPAFDLFVLPSRAEGMSNALLESMAEGIPAIATRAGGTVEVVEPGVSGILVEAGDRQALASAIGALAADPSRARALGHAARERVRLRFSLDAMLAAYRRLYESLLAGLPEARRRA